MAYVQKDNSGILFKNDRKEKDTHPDRTGNAMIDGVEYWVSGWVKEGARGPFMTLSFKPKVERRQESPRQPPPDIRPPGGNAPQGRRGSMKPDDPNDEVPF